MVTGWIADLGKPVLKVTGSVSSLFRYRANETLKGDCVSKCSKNVKRVLKHDLNWLRPCRANVVYNCCNLLSCNPSSVGYLHELILHCSYPESLKLT